MSNPWWHGAVIYQVYPRSFFDTNGDGVGDLPGIAEKMRYIADLGVDAVWISPINTSPMDDFGYDVADYFGIDPLFGTMRDFELVIEAAHKHGLKVLIDQVMAHSSDQNPWFVESRRDKTNPKADWYVWADPKPDGTPPNNWLAVFGGPAWTWDARRGQYYLHNYLSSMPDLNYHNPEVRRAVLDVFRFWLDKGVDGFRLDVVTGYYHDKELRDNPPTPPGELALLDPKKDRKNPYAMQQHIYNKSRPENLAFLEEARKLADGYGPERILLGELSVRGKQIAQFLADYTEEGKRLHTAYSFAWMNPAFSAARIRDVAKEMTAMAKGGWICWSVGNHDTMRVLTRWGLEKYADKAAPLLAALVMSLRGTSCLYEGEELGLTDADIPYDRIQDPFGRTLWPDFKGRDGCRTPMPWKREAENAGFTTGTPWLPIPPEHRERAVDVQDGVPGSILERVRAFIAWRKGHDIFRYGDMDLPPCPDNVVLVRRTRGGKSVLAGFNLDGEAIRFALPPGEWRTLDGHGFGGRLENGEAVIGGFDAIFCESE